MPPKSAISTAVAENAQAMKAPSRAITTRDKIARIKAKKEEMEEATRKAQSASKTAKPRSLPPPGEAFQDDKPKAGAKGGKKPRKPITTKDKIKAAEAVKKAQNAVKASSKSKDMERGGGGSVDRTTATGKGRASKSKGLDMETVLKCHGADVIQHEKKRKGVSVLVRPTETAKRWKAEHLELAKTEEAGNHFRLKDLPIEVRTRICRFMVVYPRFFVWPDSATGREQPDVAMVCKGVRRQVLPIYYGENTFAVDISPIETQSVGGNGKEAVAKKAERLRGIAALEKWAECLELEEAWFHQIRNWAFSYTPETVTGALRLGEEDNSFLVSFRTWRRDDLKTWNTSVEVHREARCVLAGCEEYGLCKLKQTPEWLRHTVIEILDAAAGKHIVPEMIVGLAGMLQEKAAELLDARCEEVRKSVEPDRGANVGEARTEDCSVM